MKFSEQWLREWVNPPITAQELTEQLTLVGLEVDSLTPVAGDFSNVVVGHILQINPHPDADRLRICKVDIGETVIDVVCGGQNAHEGLKVPLAKVNAVLPNNFKIRKSKIRGVESLGMICSESELGLADSSSGIMELPSDAPIGSDIRDFLQLNDCIIDVELTPNRGDCLSLLGIAREVATINRLPINTPNIIPIKASVAEQLPLNVTATEACVYYVGRVIRQIDPAAKTPLWIQEKLKRSGIRPLHLVVDITNYVLLELGQPLHAFDLDHVQAGIEVRFANKNEKIVLLDEQTLQLTTDDLLIASKGQPVALAGIKGGNDSSITEHTSDVFLESALFNSTVISKTARRYGIITDSSYRYERGIDYALQDKALERATALIVEFAGGEPGELCRAGKTPEFNSAVFLRRDRIKEIIGIELKDDFVEDTLKRLGMTVASTDNGWKVVPPSYRYDIHLEIDLIEELLRIYGLRNVPGNTLCASLKFLPCSDQKLHLSTIRNTLVQTGYQEVMTYSFVDPYYEDILKLQKNPICLLNPLSEDLKTMRSNLWPGLLKAFQYNSDRQQKRVRVFEVGLCFQNETNGVTQKRRLGGLSSGSFYNEQWGESKREVDYFDLKGDLERIFSLAKKTHEIVYESCNIPALHPGKSAEIFLNQRSIGYVGQLHPSVSQELDIKQSVYLFDLEIDALLDISLPAYKAISKFPAIKRDLAIVVSSEISAQLIQKKITDSDRELLKNVQIFDIYQGKNIDRDKKSIAFTLTFQHATRTLVDSEINDLMLKIIQILHQEFSATLRD